MTADFVDIFRLIQTRQFALARTALAKFGDHPDSALRARLAAQADWGCGDYDSALAGFGRAMQLDDRDSEAALGMARALVSMGQMGEAVTVLDRAVSECPTAGIHLLRELLRFDDRSPWPSLQRLAASGAPEVDPYAYLAWRALEVRCAAHPLEPIDLPHPRLQAMWQGFLYQNANAPPARLVGSAAQVWFSAIEAAPDSGLILECGVYFGRSLRFFASRFADARLHGFDSFEGLPEAWRSEAAGSYSTGGIQPKMPDNVQLHDGWFRDSLPRFLQEHPGEPIRFLHVDCDLYSSTVDVLDAVAGRLVPGSVLVFDDYLGYPQAEEHEFKAWHEHASAHGLKYRYLAFALLGREVALVIE